MRERREIFRTVHGSRLYGTATPDSDHDEVAVFLPPGRDILLQAAPRQFSGRQGPELVKTIPGELDFKAVTLHTFLERVVKGESSAVELLFVQGGDGTDEWSKVLALRDALVTSAVCGPALGMLGSITPHTRPKTVYHALRIAGQTIELLTTGFITLPRPRVEVDFLLRVKNGSADPVDVERLMRARVDLLEGLREDERDDRKWLSTRSRDVAQDLVVELYGKQVTG